MRIWPRTVLFALVGSVVVAACANAPISDDLSDEPQGTGGDEGSDGPTGNGNGPSGNTATTNTSGAGAGDATGAGGSGTGESSAGVGGSGTTSGGTGGGGVGACPHDVCMEGDAMTPGCDADGCVEEVCLNDDYCCTDSWDSICVGEVNDYCTITVCAAPPPMPGDVIITEIMNNPTTAVDANGEWFELYNNSADTIDLMGMTIVSSGGAEQHTIATSVVFDSGEFVVLGYNGTSAQNGNVTLDYVYGTAILLANDDDDLSIMSADATPVMLDMVSYDQTSGLDPNGASRNLDPIYMDASENDDDTNFCAATATITGGVDKGTPGADNSDCP